MNPLPTTNRGDAPAATRGAGLRWLRVASVVGIGVVLALSLPLVWAAVTAGLGLAVLGVIAAAGFGALQAVPWLMQRLENRLLALRRREARRNPIEQLQNECLRRAERLQRFRDALVAIGGQIESLRDMVDDRRREAPDQPLERQERALKRMAQFHEVNVGRLHEAQAALEAFRHQVQQKVWEWEFAQAGGVILEQLSPEQMSELTQSLLTDEALRSVQQRFNEVFASLDLDLNAHHAPTRELLSRERAQRLGALNLSGADPEPGR